MGREQAWADFSPFVLVRSVDALKLFFEARFGLEYLY
jgi:predicted component of type VI protein secretion system